MKRCPRILVLLSAVLVPMSHVFGAGEVPFTICRGMCDASAVVTVGTNCFVVADDEDNILRIYSRSEGGAPLQSVDLSHFLEVETENPEVDLEAAAPAGDYVFWISSHGANKNGKERLSRRRFFASKIRSSEGHHSIEPLGRPYMNLLDDMMADPRLKRFNLAAAARRAPKSRDALNIEGLCATPEGHLLIGFRNPIPDGKALIVPLFRPEELIVRGRGRFGDPLLIDLDGLSIRSLARADKGYFIIAGSYTGEGRSYLYRWSGNGAEKPRRLDPPALEGLNPEAIELLEESGARKLLVLSDDGTLEIGGKECKKIADPNLKYFRVTAMDVGP